MYFIFIILKFRNKFKGFDLICDNKVLLYVYCN